MVPTGAIGEAFPLSLGSFGVYLSDRPLRHLEPTVSITGYLDTLRKLSFGRDVGMAQMLERPLFWVTDFGVEVDTKRAPPMVSIKRSSDTGT